MVSGNGGLAELIQHEMLARGQTLALAESCTGGMVASSLVAVAGSSGYLDRGFVTYSNAAKTELLGVPAGIIEQQGAVSMATAEAMARGARQRAGVDLALSITGIAGPGGATTNKPVGLVYLGICRRGATAAHERHVIAGDRAAVRRAAVAAALDLLAGQVA